MTRVVVGDSAFGIDENSERRREGRWRPRRRVTKAQTESTEGQQTSGIEQETSERRVGADHPGPSRQSCRLHVRQPGGDPLTPLCQASLSPNLVVSLSVGTFLTGVRKAPYEK